MIDLTPTLNTARTTLRRITPKDQEFILQHFSDPEVCRYLVDAEPLTSPDEAMQLVEWCNPAGEKPNHNRWAICWNATGSPIGTIGFHSWDQQNNSAEIGFDLGPAYWRQGIISEVMPCVLAFGFTEMHLNRTHAAVQLENIACYQALCKQGFVAEGITRGKHYYRGKYYDHYCLSLLRREFRA